jgi:hypothetical protein
MATAGCRVLHQCTTPCCFTHVAPELHQLVVQLPALGLCCRCCILQAGHLGQQLVDHVTLLSVTQHLLKGAELTCSSACNSWWSVLLLLQWAGITADGIIAVHCHDASHGNTWLAVCR